MSQQMKLGEKNISGSLNSKGMLLYRSLPVKIL
jgi:hypothetical protein